MEGRGSGEEEGVVRGGRKREWRGMEGGGSGEGWKEEGVVRDGRRREW